MIQFWQQILPIWNAQHRQNPVAGHTCVNSNMQSTKFLLSLLTGYKKSVYNRANYIFGKTVEKLRRKAIGPVRWQPVARTYNVTFISEALYCHIRVGIMLLFI